MSLKEITTSIIKEAEREAAKILADGDAKVKTIQEKYAVLLREKQAEAHANFERRAKQKVEQARFQLQNKTSNALLTAKREVLDEVYTDAVNELAGLTGADAEKILTALVQALPDTDGEIVPVASSAGAVSAAVKASGRSITVSSQTSEGSGGFVFQGKGLRIDNRYESLVEEARGSTESDVANIVFETNV